MDSNKGGDIVFIPGRGADAIPHEPNPNDGAIIFKLASGIEYLRIDPFGMVSVSGKSVETDKEFYVALRQWLANARIVGAGELSG